MTGKQKCTILKEIRREIAKSNDISLVIADCKHKGDCRGTCPRCKSEVAALERALADRRARGKQVAVAGISAATLAAALTGCAPMDVVREWFGVEPPLEGDMRADGYFGVQYVDTEGQTETALSQGEIITLDGDIAIPDETMLLGAMVAPEDDTTPAITDALTGEVGEVPPEDSKTEFWIESTEAEEWTMHTEDTAIPPEIKGTEDLPADTTAPETETMPPEDPVLPPVDPEWELPTAGVMPAEDSTAEFWIETATAEVGGENDPDGEDSEDYTVAPIPPEVSEELILMGDVPMPPDEMWVEEPTEDGAP